MRAPGDRIGPRGESDVAPGPSDTEESRERSDAPDLRDGEIGGRRCADPPGSGAGPAPRPRHSPNSFAAVLGGGRGHGQPGLTREGTGAGRCGLQILEIVTGVRLDGVRSVVVVHDAAEEVEQLGGGGEGSLALWLGTYTSSPRALPTARAGLTWQAAKMHRRPPPPRRRGPSMPCSVVDLNVLDDVLGRDGLSLGPGEGDGPR